MVLDHTVAMRAAIDVAAANPAAPFGAVICDADGNVVARGVNSSATNPIMHGEIAAIQAYAVEHPGADYSSLVLYTTAEPCPMCMAAIVWAGFKLVVFGSSIPFLQLTGWGQITIRAAEVAARVVGLPTCRVMPGVLESECNALFLAVPEHGYPDLEEAARKKEGSSRPKPPESRDGLPAVLE
eukprot:tig00001437_g8742.t1